MKESICTLAKVSFNFKLSPTLSQKRNLTTVPPVPFDVYHSTRNASFKKIKLMECWRSNLFVFYFVCDLRELFRWKVWWDWLTCIFVCFATSLLTNTFLNVISCRLFWRPSVIWWTQNVLYQTGSTISSWDMTILVQLITAGTLISHEVILLPVFLSRFWTKCLVSTSNGNNSSVLNWAQKNHFKPGNSGQS